MNPTFLELVQRFLVRTLTANFQKERAADDERQTLAQQTPPIADPWVQDYLAWRRAVLWIAGVLLSIGVLFALLQHRDTAEQIVLQEAAANGHLLDAARFQQRVGEVTQLLKPGNLEVIDGLQSFLLFLKVAVAALAIVAALSWVRVRRSLALARWGWFCALLVPLLVSCWPWTNSLDFGHVDQEMGVAGQGRMIKQAFAVALATLLVGTVAPKLFALFPGIMRASLALKTLLPETAVPGWLTVVFAPFFIGFLLLLLCFLSQVQGDWLVILAIGLMVAGAGLYLRRAKDLVRPHTAAEVDTILASVRGPVSFCNVAGVVLLMVWLFNLDEVPWGTACHILFDAGGGVLFTMVVIADITLAMLAYTQQQSAAFQSSDLRAMYERRLKVFTDAGLADVEGALGVKDLSRLRGRDDAAATTPR